MPATTSPYVQHEHHEFAQAAAEALADQRLRGILTTLGERLGGMNRKAWNEFAASSETRDRARAIKDATLAELDVHLATLADSVSARGGHVHFAATGAEAVQTILDLIARRGATRVVKSKSMTSEEIHLNPALEAAGIETVETDLGEYIIQIAGHRPSHIVGPALHLSVDEVAEILSTKSPQPLGTDREALCAFARRQLREKFAAAEVGISGANFAVAETGSIVIISNEGNARLTTSMPKVHIAVMGIEKVIPKLADLPVFLKVLARAATGQKLSCYTSIITGPRQPGELDGPEEFHLVLLDNGRSKILGSPLRESLFCIRCGACLNACPVYRSIGGHAYGGVYSGPIGAVLTPLYDGLAANHHLPHVSSLCGACQAACPVKIAIPELLVKLREELHHEAGHGSWFEGFAYGFWARTLASPWLYGWGTWLATRLVGWWYSSTGWITGLPGPLGGWTATRDFPAPATSRFRDWWEAEGKANG